MIHYDTLYLVIIDIIELFIFNYNGIVTNSHASFPLRHIDEAMNLTDRLFYANSFLPQI